ncbi:MAG: hypothetical protein NVSMB62_13430 [Acidobacteriaceae bacterium]
MEKVKRLDPFPTRCGAVVLAFSFCAGTLLAQERIKNADACGFIVDLTGTAVEGATVVAVSGEKTLATSSSLSDGSFHFAEQLNTAVDFKVSARGFASSTHEIEHLKSVNEKHCRHPLYVVLAPGEGSSVVTTKKSALPKPKR